MAQLSALPIPLRAILHSKPVFWAIVAGAVAGLALAFLPMPLDALTRWLIAWDTALVVYIAILVAKMIGATPEHMAERAAETDEGRQFVLVLSLAAVVASIAAIVLELQSAQGAGSPWRIVFVFATVALSWTFVHASFASHYAHEYYGPADSGRGQRKGLKFPGGGAPDFWDFWHFAFVIGVAAQTADVQIESKAIRRIVTLHGVAAFLFNTVILALAINLAAALF
jgi:uncharacterized membrane protein